MLNHSLPIITSMKCNVLVSSLLLLETESTYATLRYLAGGSYLDVHYFCGISQSNFYTSVWQVIHLINRCSSLHISFPQTSSECAVSAEGFWSISSGYAIVNCVSVIDGLLVQIITPSKKEAKNVRSFLVVTAKPMG